MKTFYDIREARAEIEQLRGNLSLAEEGLANYAQENEQLKADAKRYSWLRDWVIQGRPRAEIDPHGHVAVRTTAEWEALLDEAISRTAVPQSADHIAMRNSK